MCVASPIVANGSVGTVERCNHYKIHNDRKCSTYIKAAILQTMLRRAIYMHIMNEKCDGVYERSGRRMLSLQRYPSQQQ